MRIKMVAGIAAAALALGACGGKGDDKLGQQAQDNAENKADQLDAMADNTTGAQSDALKTKADITRDMGDAKEEAIDDADVNAEAMTNTQKSEMTKAQ